MLWWTRHDNRVGSWCGVSLPKLVHHRNICEHLHISAYRGGCTSRPSTHVAELFNVHETSLMRHRDHDSLRLLQLASLPAIYLLCSNDSFELMDRCAQSQYTGLWASLKDLLWRGLQVAP